MKISTIDEHANAASLPRTKPFFEAHPEMFLKWTVHPTKNAVLATKFQQNKANFDLSKRKIHKAPFANRLLHWFMTVVLRWKYIPAPIMKGSPVFQAVLNDIDRAKGLK